MSSEVSLLASLREDAAGRRQHLFGALGAATAAPDSTLFFDRYYARTLRDERLVRALQRSDAEMANLGRAVMTALRMQSAEPAARGRAHDSVVDPTAGIFAA